MIRKIYSTTGTVARKFMTLAVVIAALALALPAKAVTTYDNITIGNFVYALHKADNSAQNYAFCKSLSSTGASATSLECPGYVMYNNERYRVDGISAYGFQNNTILQSIRFGYGITMIQYGAFKGCTALTAVFLPSSVEAVYNQAFAGCSKLNIVTYAGDVAPLVYSGTFENTPATKYLSCATYRGVNAMKADATWNSAFNNIGRNLGYVACDFQVYNSTGGCWQYYVIKNGIPYSNSGSSRSSCVLTYAGLAGGSTSSSYSIKLEQNVANTSNNSPGYYHFYGVADSAFMNNSIITKIEDNSTFGKYIGVRAFYGCTNLTSAELRVDTIRSYAFYGCTKLASVNFYNPNLGQGLKQLGGYSFGNTALTTVTIPKSTTQSMGYAPFYNCQSLTEIIVDSENTAYCAYNKCLYNKSRTWLYQIPASLNLSGNSTMFASELTRVLAYAGYGNGKITDIFLPYGCTTLDQYAFSNCSKLKNIHVPSSVTSVHANAFYKCPAIKYVYINQDTPPGTDWFANSEITPSNVYLYVPYMGKNFNYPSNTTWNKYKLQTGELDHLRCWDFMFSGLYYTVTDNTSFSQGGMNYVGKCRVVQGIQGTYNIAVYALCNNKNYLPTEIGYDAFRGSQAGITLNGCYTIETILPRAFKNTELATFPFTGVKYIYANAFEGCSKLKTDVGVTTSLTSLIEVAQNAFNGSAITAFKAPATLKTLGTYAFGNATSLTNVNMSACSNLTSIPDYCFAYSDCNVVSLPNNITTIGTYAFRACNLSTFNFPAQLKTIKNSAFYLAYLPGEVELPYGITTLEENSLSTISTTRIVLPSTVSAVHSRFFNTPYYNNPKLASVVINKTSPLTFTNDNEDLTYNYQQATALQNKDIYVPVGRVSAWKADPRWSYNAYLIQEGSYDFTDKNNGFKYTVLAPGDETSGNGRCELVYNPQTINRAATVEVNATNYDKYGRRYFTESIGDKAFYGSTALTTIKGIKLSTLKRIGNYAFANSNLSKIMHTAKDDNYNSECYLGTNVNYIGAYAFNNCKNLHELFLPQIDVKNPLTCGNYFFGNNASDFKLWVDYRRLGDFVGLSTTKWDESKVNPHLLLDSQWQSFACVKPINFQGTNVEAYTVSNYTQSEKKATMSNVTTLAATNGGVVHGNANGTYYRLNYGTGGTTSSWLEGLTASAQTVNSSSSLSYFKLNASNPVFDKVTTSTTFNRGYAYLKLNTSITGGATTIITNLSGDVGLKGDVNGDGKVNVTDVTTLVNMILGVVTMDQTRADVTGDGKVNVSDVTALINIILGIS